MPPFASRPRRPNWLCSGNNGVIRRKGGAPMAAKAKIVAALQKAYNMELETVMNYLANSIHLDGVRADAIKKALTADITGELAHATQVGHRLKQLGATVPGSLKLTMTQKAMQPPAETTDVTAVIRGVLAAEEEAVAHYKA